MALCEWISVKGNSQEDIRAPAAECDHGRKPDRIIRGREISDAFAGTMQPEADPRPVPDG